MQLRHGKNSSYHQFRLRASQSAELHHLDGTATLVGMVAQQARDLRGVKVAVAVVESSKRLSCKMMTELNWQRLEVETISLNYAVIV